MAHAVRDDAGETPAEVRRRPWWRSSLGWTVAGSVVAALGVVVALLAWQFPTVAQDPSRPSDGRQPLSVRIHPSSYDITLSRWAPYGPFYEGSDRLYPDYHVTHGHAYGNTVGSMVYLIEIGRFDGQRAELGARLSADSVGYAGPADAYSDVTLLINGTDVGTKRVIPDNGSGAQYPWSFPASLLHQGGPNRVEFRVAQNAQFANGLCIYGTALAPGQSDAWITISAS
jgi:hypothetical protein